MTEFATSSDGILLAYDRVGRPDWPVVVLAHGGGQTRRSWRAAADLLPENGFEVRSLDLRGHGESGWASSTGYGLADYARDVEAIATLDRRPVHLVGASLGGLASLIALSALGERARSVTLVDIVPRFEPEGSDHIQQFIRSGLDGFADLDEAGLAIAAFKRTALQPGFENSLRHSLREGADGRLYWHWDPARLREEGMTFTTEEIEGAERAAAAFRGPMLLIRGGESTVVSDVSESAFRQVVPHLETRVIPGATHMVVSDSNAAFARAMLQFLARDA